MQVAETFAFPIPLSELPANTREQLHKMLPAAAAKPARSCGHAGAPCNDDVARRTRSADKAPKEPQDSKDGSSPADGHAELALSEYVRLDTCVTVVDASVFFDNLHSLEDLHDRCAAGTVCRLVCLRAHL